MSVRRRAATLAGIATLASIPTATAMGDARTILGAVNYERQMAGIDAVTTSKPLEQGCVRHALYMNQNGVLTHSEDQSKPGYTPEGAFAASKGVLARNTAGFTTNPWKFAPFHEFQVLHPWLQQTGIGVSGDYACMFTLGERAGGMIDDIKLMTAPGTGQYIRPAEVAREAPFTPGEEFGIPQGTKTGPHIYVYAVGPQRFPNVVVKTATLTATESGVDAPLRWVDASSSKSGRYLDGGAILIPTSPLKEGAVYGLRVEAETTSSSGQKILISRTTSFTTGPDESEIAESPETSDTVTASSNRGSSGPAKSKPSVKPTVLGAEGDAKLAVAVAWNKRRTGLRVRIRCESVAVRCSGPMRVLVRKKGDKLGKLRFKARKGPLKISLAPGRQIIRRVQLTKPQQHHGKKRGFSVRWGGGTPVRVTAKK